MGRSAVLLFKTKSNEWNLLYHLPYYLVVSLLHIETAWLGTKQTTENQREVTFITPYPWRLKKEGRLTPAIPVEFTQKRFHPFNRVPQRPQRPLRPENLKTKTFHNFASFVGGEYFQCTIIGTEIKSSSLLFALSLLFVTSLQKLYFYEGKT